MPLEELYKLNHEAKKKIDKFRKKYSTKRAGMLHLLHWTLYKKYKVFVPLKYKNGKDHEFWQLVKAVLTAVDITARITERKGGKKNG